MSAIPTASILDHLRTLVAADSSDPVAQMSPSHPAIVHSVRTLERAGFAVTLRDLGGGCVNLLAVRGNADVRHGTLFNCHLDTVKVNPNWTRDPFSLSVEEEGADARAYGLGACDIKGAAACLLAAAQATDAPMAVLFTTDEEGGRGTCVKAFLDAERSRWSRVIVAEPTGARAVLQHRGFASFEVSFSGIAGHTSGADAARGSAIHRAVGWMHAALALADSGGVLEGSRFNIGIVQGGTASNVVASETTVRFGFRPEPGLDAPERTGERVRALKALLPSDGSAVWTDRFIAPPLTADGGMAARVASWGLDAGPDVDFWTEAALFAAGDNGNAGLPAVVLGPGDIAQAHAADEFVAVSQLEACAAAYASVVRSDGAARVPGTALVGGESHAS